MGLAMRWIAVVLLCFLFIPSVQASNQEPEEVIFGFYSWLLSNGNFGISLPSEKSRAELEEFLSPQLIKLFKRASETESKCIEATKIFDKQYIEQLKKRRASSGNYESFESEPPIESKPPVVEGPMFTGLEDASDVSYGDLRRRGKLAFIDVDVIAIDIRLPKASRLRANVVRNSLVISMIGKQWFIQDIKFRKSKSVKDFLVEYVRKYQGCTSSLK